jgi:hypothetical protein
MSHRDIPALGICLLIMVCRKLSDFRARAGANQSRRKTEIKGFSTVAHEQAYNARRMGSESTLQA